MSNLLNLQLAPEPEPKRGRGRPPLAPEVVAERQRVKELIAHRVKEERQAREAVAASSNPVDQAVTVLRNGSAVAAFVGFALGAFMPLASYNLIHFEVAARPVLWVLIAGSLAFSATSVYLWARHVFGYWIKAGGFVVALEGTLALTHIVWLGLSALAILMLLNGVTAAVTLQSGGLRRATADDLD